MVFKNMSVLVLRTKLASALERLKILAKTPGHHGWLNCNSWIDIDTNIPIAYLPGIHLVQVHRETFLVSME